VCIIYTLFESREAKPGGLDPKASNPWKNRDLMRKATEYFS